MSFEHTERCRKWGLAWRQHGLALSLIWEAGKPCLFRTRREARAYATQRYGYIKQRPDLQAAPHHWQMPLPVKVLGLVYLAP